MCIQVSIVRSKQLYVKTYSLEVMVFICYYEAGTDRKLSVSKKVIKSTACMISKDLVKTNEIQDGRRKRDIYQLKWNRLHEFMASATYFVSVSLSYENQEFQKHIIHMSVEVYIFMPSYACAKVYKNSRSDYLISHGSANNKVNYFAILGLSYFTKIFSRNFVRTFCSNCDLNN